MNTGDPKSNLKDKILQEIRSGDISMRPKIYFTLQIVALIAVALGVLIVSIFILNFIVFSLRINEHESLLGFGPMGLLTFLRLFPWPLLVADIILILALQVLLRNFQLGYRIPALYLFGGLFLATILTGFALDRGTPFNDQLFDRAEHHTLPRPFLYFYGGAHQLPPKGSGICMCTIVSIQGNVLTVEDTRNGTSTLTVVLPDNSAYATTSLLRIGDKIFIAGEEDNEIIRAFGIRKVDPNTQYFRFHTQH